MDLQNITLFKMADKSMKWANQRQQVVSQNIANINTPKYRPTELNPLSFAKELKQRKTVMAVTSEKHRTEDSVNISMETRQGNHISSRYAPQMFRSFQHRASQETSLDGNGVVLEQESLKLSENRSMHDRAATIYQKYNTMLQTSLGTN